jgi:hypothetical protein
MVNELESVSIGDLVIRSLVLEGIIAEEKDNPKVAEPKRQLAIITDEINRRCPQWERKTYPPTPSLEGRGEGIKIQLNSAELRKEK